MSSPPPEKPGMDHRRQFNSWLNNPQNMEGTNKVAFHTIRVMSGKMETDGNGCTPEHANALKTSLQKGNTICTVMKDENPHVVQSQGTGMTYAAGKMVHGGIKKVSDFFGGEQ